jgi:ubiquinone/menaquinone biosynthesis C-methylase UbiE
MGKGKRVKGKNRVRRRLQKSQRDATSYDSKKTQWTDPLRFQQIEAARNQTLGVQRRLYQMVLNDQIKPGHKVLEIGAGRGWLKKNVVPEVLKKNWTEMDEDMTALRQNPGKRKIAGDTFKIPLADASLDAVVDSSSLDLFEPKDHDRIAREIHRVLKPGGRVISFQDGLPNPAVWSENFKREDVESGSFDSADLEKKVEVAPQIHERFSNALARSLSRNGMTVLVQQPLFGDGHFPVEERHGKFAEPFSSYSRELQRIYREAPGYRFWDGVFMPVNLHPIAKRRIPHGHKVEIFQGRVLVARKPQNPQ